MCNTIVDVTIAQGLPRITLGPGFIIFTSSSEYRISRFDLPNTASFRTKKVNETTFVVTEDDAFGEHPFIYVKVHPRAPVILLSDTGCDKPSGRKSSARWTHLRPYLERCPITSNKRKPLNEGGLRKYVVICTHCHYDHIGGISQFAVEDATDIVASAAGRDFIESDLAEHSLFKYRKAPVPDFQVTFWAQAFERLQYPLRNTLDAHFCEDVVDLGITIIQTPGHTPDELAWYDHDEMHLYVGDSFYEEGEDGMPVIWPSHGNLVEWAFSMQKLQTFVRSQNTRAIERAMKTSDDGDNKEEGWVQVPKRVKIGCGHQTADIDGEEILAELERLWWAIEKGNVPIIKSETFMGELNHTWRETGPNVSMSFRAPARLMNEAREFFHTSPCSSSFV